MWGVIQEEVNNGWFVPSRAEWSAFANAFSINSVNYTEYGLSNDGYWSSSQYDTNDAWDASFKRGCMDSSNVDYYNYVRLGTTF